MMLAKAGVPWETACGLSPAELLAYCVIAGELEGGRFNWGSLQWEKADG